MAEDTQQAKSEDQEGAMPTSETDQTETQEESLETPAGGSENLELPEGVSERTKEQFDKLKSQSDALKAELASYRQKLFNQTETKEEKPLYDPVTGNVDISELEATRKRALDTEKRLKTIEQNMVQQSHDQEVRALYEAHPELKDQKSKEARELYDEADRLWMHSQAYPEKYGGMVLTMKQAADRAKARVQTPTKEEIDAKEQASLAASGRPTQGVQSKIVSEEETQRLSYGTRVGDKQSMIERMRRIRETP